MKSHGRKLETCFILLHLSDRVSAGKFGRPQSYSMYYLFTDRLVHSCVRERAICVETEITYAGTHIWTQCPETIRIYKV